jgi:hypothetical protein
MQRFFSPPHKRWRTWLATYLLVAVAWPATGPLPWLVLESAEHAAAHSRAHHGNRMADAAGDAAQEEQEETHGGADVPGSPTHPLDHDCAQCQVLKHLARCVLPDGCAPAPSQPPGDAVAPLAARESPHATFIATRPPIRGPPLPV